MSKRKERWREITNVSTAVRTADCGKEHLRSAFSVEHVFFIASKDNDAIALSHMCLTYSTVEISIHSKLLGFQGTNLRVSKTNHNSVKKNFH